MNYLQKNLIIAICLLAFVGGIFVLKYARQKNESMSLAEQVEDSANYAKQQEAKAREINTLAEQARTKAMADLRKAEQARKMLEKAKLQNELNQKQMLEALNAQLEREANARSAAENASIELAKQKEALLKAVNDAKDTIAKLKDSKVQKANSGDMLNFYQDLIKQKDAEIAALKKKQLELEAMRKASEDAQRKIEQEILDRGGEITLPRQRRILSPNLRTS